MHFITTMNSLMTLQPLSVMVFGSLLSLGAYTIYMWLLPKPIPGIPYNRKATKSVFGDIPELMEHLKHSKTITDWFLSNVSVPYAFPMRLMT